MGIIDSVKKSLSGGDESGSTFDSSQYDSSFQSESSSSSGDNPFSDNQPSNPQGQPQGAQNTSNQQDLQPPQGGQGRDPTPQSPIEQNQGTGAGGQQQGSPLDSPNAQAGRPEQGGAMPQVSSDTQKEMENAGFDFNEGQQNRQQGGGRDLEEIKSQNEKIIDLLRSIERKLDSGQEDFNQGRRTDRGGNSGGRHGGRR
jgi:hypothetical protein